MRRISAVILISLSLILCICASCITREAAARQEGNGSVLENTGVSSLNTTIVTSSGISVRGGHVRYMPCAAGQFRPGGSVTRAEAAAILCALLDEDTDIPNRSAAYADVTEQDSFYTSVQTVSALGLMAGRGNSRFCPSEPITRAELCAALCRLMGQEQVEALAFPDVGEDHWAMGYIAAMVTRGWLYGCGDGNFYPDAPATRAETAVLVNRVRDYTVNTKALDMACESYPYVDVAPRSWAYYDILDAAYTNDFLAYVYGEVEGVQPGLVLLGSRMCHVNASTGGLDFYEKGFHTVDGGLYYVDEDGFFIRRNQPGLQELDGSMFYVERADGPYVTNYTLERLYFGENGRYTTTDPDCDALLNQIMAPIIQGDTASLLNETKLREAYDYMINGGYDYLARNTGWVRGSTGWELECAKVMYQTKGGSCYYWAAAFVYLARRLGFQAYPVCGGVNENNAIHAWCMIDDDYGNQYIYDVELDWAYRTGAHGRVQIRPGRNLFKQPRGASVLYYIFPGEDFIAPPKDDEGALGDDINAPQDPNDPGSSGYGDLLTGEGGTPLVEGVDYVISYHDNGDGTTTITITYITGPNAGVTVTRTVPNGAVSTPGPEWPTPTPGEWWNGEPTPTPPEGGWWGGEPTPTPPGEQGWWGGEPTPTPPEGWSEPTPTPPEGWSEPTPTPWNGQEPPPATDPPVITDPPVTTDPPVVTDPPVEVPPVTDNTGNGGGEGQGGGDAGGGTEGGGTGGGDTGGGAEGGAAGGGAAAPDPGAIVPVE